MEDAAIGFDMGHRRIGRQGAHQRRGAGRIEFARELDDIGTAGGLAYVFGGQAASGDAGAA